MLSLDSPKPVSLHGPLSSALQYQTPLPLVYLNCRSPVHLPGFSPSVAHSIMPVSSLSHSEVTFICLQSPEGNFLRGFFSGPLTSVSHFTCFSPLCDKPAWLLTGPSWTVYLQNLCHACSFKVVGDPQQPNFTISYFISLTSVRKDSWITFQMCLRLPRFNLSSWFLNS